MKRYLLLAFALIGILFAGCSTANKANPFARDTFCEKMFGFPPKAFAACLDIEDDLLLRPEELPVRDDDDDF